MTPTLSPLSRANPVIKLGPYLRDISKKLEPCSFWSTTISMILRIWNGWRREVGTMEASASSQRSILSVGAMALGNDQALSGT